MRFFAFNWDAARKKNVFIVWKALLKLGGSSSAAFVKQAVRFGKRTVAC